MTTTKSPINTKEDIYKYNNPNEHELEAVPESPTRRVALHPVRAFPTRNDTLTRAFFGSSVPKHRSQVEKARRWLDPLSVDPKFGVDDDSQEGMIRRTFRRLESSALFLPPTKDSTSLEELISDSFVSSLAPKAALPPMRSTASAKSGSCSGFGHGSRDGFEFSESYLSTRHGVGSTASLANSVGGLGGLGSSTASSSTGMKLVLVDEGQLRELSKFESILREERALLGEQCAMVLSDIQAHANIPLPATRLALHNLCETEMRQAASKIAKLTKQWKAFCKQNNYNRPHLYQGKDLTFFQHGPLESRPLKLKLARDAVERWELGKERDTMSFEDDQSRLVNRYLDAQIRKKDYDRYYILATRYGRYTPAEFSLDARPGRRYWMKAWRAAMMFQRAWDRYWAIAKLRRHRASRRVQTVWRRYWCMKTIRPIYRIRKHFSRYASFLLGFRKWREYQEMCRRVKALVELWVHTWVPVCFESWKGECGACACMRSMCEGASVCACVCARVRVCASQCAC